eukprot:Clim_evm10s205 gene=Clim_evmTU10s205
MLTHHQANVFQDKGYVIVRRPVVGIDEIDYLLQCAQQLSCRHSPVQLVQRHGCVQDAGDVLRDEVIADFVAHIDKCIEIVRPLLLGEDSGDLAIQPWLLNDQFISKPPGFGSGTQFVWHRDRAYLPEAHQRSIPGFAIWTPLQEVSPENGTIELRPLPAERSQDVDTASADDATEDDELVFADAGSCVVMANNVLHRGLSNETNTWRHVYMPQIVFATETQMQNCAVGSAVRAWQDSEARLT